MALRHRKGKYRKGQIRWAYLFRFAAWIALIAGALILFNRLAALNKDDILNALDSVITGDLLGSLALLLVFVVLIFASSNHDPAASKQDRRKADQRRLNEIDAEIRAIHKEPWKYSMAEHDRLLRKLGDEKLDITIRLRNDRY